MIGHQIRNKMTNHGTIRYGIEVAIPVVLAHNFQLVLPVGTQQDLAGGNIRITIPIGTATRGMIRRNAIIEGVRRPIWVTILTYRRMEVI